jgi:hypothetical protein
MRSSRAFSAAFTLVEVILTISLSAVFFTAAALVFQNIAVNSRSLGTLEPVTLDETTFENLLGVENETVSVYSAPNHGRSAFAGNLAEHFREDVAAASAVYCVGRNGLNTLRPATIPYPSGSETLDTPERFLAHLVAQYGGPATAQFVDYSGISNAEDLTIFVLQPSATATVLQVQSVYDLDVVPATGLGNYVAVRRYVGGELTAYYDILYPEALGNAFRPLAVHFYRRGLAEYEGNADISKYMVAEEHPFYMIWWPDPSAQTLEAPSDPPTPSAAAGTAVWDYYKMGGRTRFMFTVPAFPSQL